MYGAPYDPLGVVLGVRPDRLRGIVARWRPARYVQTARLGPGPAWWRSERRIRAAAGAIRTGHLPDAEVSWPEISASPYAGQLWAIEAELTPKPLARTTAIMGGLLTRTIDYQPGARPAAGSPGGSG